VVLPIKRERERITDKGPQHNLALAEQ
jgi:hypothetical protein